MWNISCEQLYNFMLPVLIFFLNIVHWFVLRHKFSHFIELITSYQDMLHANRLNFANWTGRHVPISLNCGSRSTKLDNGLKLNLKQCLHALNFLHSMHLALCSWETTWSKTWNQGLLMGRQMARMELNLVYAVAFSQQKACEFNSEPWMKVLHQKNIFSYMLSMLLISIY